MLTENEREALRKRLMQKFGASALGSAMEDDAEGEGISPDELAEYRRPVVEPPPAPPMVESEDNADAEALDRARDRDADAMLSAGLTNSSKKLASAITSGIYRPDYVKPDLSAESDELGRQKAVRDYLLRSRQADANAANAQAALLNAKRERAVASPKAPAADPLIEEKRAKLEAETEKLKRPPAVKPTKNPNGRDLPAGEASALGELGTVGEMVDDLGKAWGDARGMAAFVTKYVPGTDASRYDDVKLATAQVVGTILEGGKLTDADLPKYLRLIPDASDGKERATQKIATMKRLIDLKRSGKLSGLGSAGFNVGGFDNSGTSPKAPASAVRMRSPDGMQSGLVPAAKVDAAKRKGWVIVDAGK